MAFHVVYVAGGELDKVKRVEYVKEIKNFAQLSQPYNKMLMINVPAVEGVYDLNWTSPNEEMELLSLVVTCSGYGENDYYNLYVNNERWFDTWFPTEVKEGLYIGTATYVYKLEPESVFKLKFVNMSGTSKKVWLGIRLLREKKVEDVITVEMLDTQSLAPPESDLGIAGTYYKELEDATVNDYTEDYNQNDNQDDITSNDLYNILVEKYKAKGYSEQESKVLAYNNYDYYSTIYNPPNDFDLEDD